MQKEIHIKNEIVAHRYKGPDPKYAIVISHGIGGHGGIYNRFCVHHASKGADIWAYDAPGHGQSTANQPRGKWTMSGWVDAAVMYAEHVKSETGLPVFSMGSSLGVAAAFSALHSDAVRAAILMGSPAIPGTPAIASMGEPWRNENVRKILATLGRAARLDVGLLFNFDEDYGYAGAAAQARLDPWTTWSYDLASWASLFEYEPKIPPGENEKPVLVSSGGKDPSFPPKVMRAVAEAIAGPVEYHCMEEGSHQLMQFHTEEYSSFVHDWALRQL